MNRRRNLIAALAIALASQLATGLGTARAQQPLDLVTFVVGYPAGGATDTVARLVAEAVQGKYANGVVVMNKAGAGGQIAAGFVKDQPATGARCCSRRRSRWSSIPTPTSSCATTR
jgi:tripartite-type tricarboxylate transporter receptor subunit TctC